MYKNDKCYMLRKNGMCHVAHTVLLCINIIFSYYQSISLFQQHTHHLMQSKQSSSG